MEVLTWQTWMALGSIVVFGLVGMWIWNDPFNDEMEEGGDDHE